MKLDSMKGISSPEVKNMLNIVHKMLWRELTKWWAVELEEQPKLCVLNELVRGGLALDVWE